MSAMELKVPPLAVTALCAALMAAIDWLLPQARFALPFAGAVAVLVALAGVAVIVLGGLAFRRAETSVNPFAPGKASSLVTGGIYRLTRNPMYLGMLLMLCGWSFFLSNAAVWAGPVALVLYLDRFQIVPEERMLGRLFGDEFRAYRARVRRWI